MITPGTHLGRYEIRSKLGAGGMGEVYLAEDTTLGRKVAIKFLPEQLMGDERATKRLIREANAQPHWITQTSALFTKSAGTHATPS